MAFSHPAIRRASADGLRWLAAWLPVRRAAGGQEAASGCALLRAAVVITTLPWLGALLAYAIEAGWPLSAAQSRWLQTVRSVCAAVLLAEWMVALAVGIAWLLMLLMRLRRRSGADSGTVSASDARASASSR